ncbi:hypothetical protein AB0B56_02300 [Streptosporangium canum]|uniref:hypothetical protein n=1 Tax=Streptosporangium canum TaxID=324952 RepID=UPI00341BE6B3
MIAARHAFLPPGAPGHPSGISQWLAHGAHELHRSGQGVHLTMDADGLVVGVIGDAGRGPLASAMGGKSGVGGRSSA